MGSHRYFYLGFGTGAESAAMFVRTIHHPLHPDELPKITVKVAHALTKGTGVIIDPGSVTITSVLELEFEVARARWPQDFPTVFKDVAFSTPEEQG